MPPLGLTVYCPTSAARVCDEPIGSLQFDLIQTYTVHLWGKNICSPLGPTPPWRRRHVRGCQPISKWQGWFWESSCWHGPELHLSQGYCISDERESYIVILYNCLELKMCISTAILPCCCELSFIICSRSNGTTIWLINLRCCRWVLPRNKLYAPLISH